MGHATQPQAWKRRARIAKDIAIVDIMRPRDYDLTSRFKRLYSLSLNLCRHTFRFYFRVDPIWYFWTAMHAAKGKSSRSPYRPNRRRRNTNFIERVRGECFP
jgi:hypothetical protein